MFCITGVFLFWEFVQTLVFIGIGDTNTILGFLLTHILVWVYEHYINADMSKFILIYY